MKVQYKVFESNQDFVDWQDNLNENISILEMAPVITYTRVESVVNRFENNTNFNTSDNYNTVGVFVTYTEDDKTE